MKEAVGISGGGASCIGASVEGGSRGCRAFGMCAQGGDGGGGQCLILASSFTYLATSHAPYSCSNPFTPNHAKKKSEDWGYKISWDPRGTYATYEPAGSPRVGRRWTCDHVKKLIGHVRSGECAQAWAFGVCAQRVGNTTPKGNWPRRR